MLFSATLRNWNPIADHRETQVSARRAPKPPHTLLRSKVLSSSGKEVYTVERTRQSRLPVCNMLNLLHHTHFGQAGDDSSAGNAHPLWQQSDLLSAFPITPIRIERILAPRSGLSTNEKGGLAAGSGCGNAHIPALPSSQAAGVGSCCLQPRCVVPLGHFIDPHSSDVRTSTRHPSTIPKASSFSIIRLNKTNDNLGCDGRSDTVGGSPSTKQ